MNLDTVCTYIKKQNCETIPAYYSYEKTAPCSICSDSNLTKLPNPDQHVKLNTKIQVIFRVLVAYVPYLIIKYNIPPALPF